MISVTVEGETCYVIVPFTQTAPERNADYWTNHFENFLKPLIEENTGLEALRSEALAGEMNKEALGDVVTARLVVADLTRAMAFATRLLRAHLVALQLGGGGNRIVGRGLGRVVLGGDEADRHGEHAGRSQCQQHLLHDHSFLSSCRPEVRGGLRAEPPGGCVLAPSR